MTKALLIFYFLFIIFSSTSALPVPAMLWVEGGSFSMGQDDPDIHSEAWTVHEQPVHKVFVDGFYMAEREISQALYEAVTGENRALQRYGAGPDFPAYYISWYDAIEFCNKLSVLEGRTTYYHIDKETEDLGNTQQADTYKWTVSIVPDSNGYRLPTEAEWEFAARGGVYSLGFTYAGSDDIRAVAWYRENSHWQSQKSALKVPNELGLYDMSGNLWEWCWDWFAYDYYQNSPEENPQGPESGSSRVARGGSWVYHAYACAVTSRAWNRPYIRSNYFGIRLVLDQLD